MKEFSKEMVLSLAQQNMFSLSDEEIEKCIASSRVFLEQIESLKSIDTRGVEAMDMPYDTINEWMREDSVTHLLDKNDLLSNAPTVEGDYIEIVKVVK